MLLTRRIPSPWRRLAPGLLLLPLAVTAPAQVPADAVLRDFQPMSDYILEVGGKAVPDARIYQTRRLGAVLIISSALPAAVVINPRAESVESLLPAKLTTKADGSIDIQADAVLKRQGGFQIDGQDVRFTVDGKAAAIRPRPPLLGLRKVSELKAYSDHYEKSARSYTPNGTAIAALKRQPQAIVVRVYFGSWCSTCKQELPKMVRVEQELTGSKIRFEYYGLPEGVGQDPEAKRLSIRSIPTGVVYASGREIGRIQGGEWSSPEVALRDLLTAGAGKSGR